ncbi:MAG: AcrR family transcriptional regulator [Limisphaerales bacterium]|jgi:AcrR family transcriptional regulator
MSTKASIKVEGESQGRRYKNLSQDERIAERRQQFISAAVKIFGSKGYKSAKVTTICKEARLTERYFYESFQNKEELFVHAYQYATEDLYNVLLEVLSKETQPEALVNKGISAFYTWCKDQPNHSRLILLEILGVNARIDALYTQRIAEFASLIMTMAKRALTKNGKSITISAVDEQVMGIAMAGTVIQTANYWLLNGYQIPIETLMKNTERIFGASISALSD